MPRKTYNKLIRDRIPEILKNNGKTAAIRSLRDTEFRKALLDKLAEEANECAEANNTEDIKDELADVQEVLNALAETFSISLEDVERRRSTKYEERGGFKERLFLEYVDE